MVVNTMTMMHLGSLCLCVISVHVMCVITSVLCQECQSEIQLSSNHYVANIIVDSSQLKSHDVNDHDLFDFGNIERFYCAKGGFKKPLAMKIYYRSPVLLTQIGMHGDNKPAGFVTNFSLSFSEDGKNFTDYIRNTTTSVFAMSSHMRHRFTLSPPITASSLMITINDWSIQPCMGLLMLGCNFKNVVDDSSDISNRTVSGTSSSQVDDMALVVTSVKSVLPTESTITQVTSVKSVLPTESTVTQVTSIKSVLPTESTVTQVTSVKSVLPTESTITHTVTQTITESFTIYHTTTVTDLYCTPSSTPTPSSSLTPSPSPTPSPSLTQSSDTAGSTSCSSSDSDNTHTLIYVAVAIVIAGLFITITVVVVGVLVCHHYQKEKDSDRSSAPLNVKYKNANGTDTGKVLMIEVDNELYGRAISPKLKSDPVSPAEDNEDALYDEVDTTKKEPAIVVTADNPQYGDTMKQSDSAAGPKSNESIYSYAIP